ASRINPQNHRQHRQQRQYKRINSLKLHVTELHTEGEQNQHARHYERANQNWLPTKQIPHPQAPSVLTTERTAGQVRLVEYTTRNYRQTAPVARPQAASSQTTAG